MSARTEDKWHVLFIVPKRAPYLREYRGEEAIVAGYDTPEAALDRAKALLKDSFYYPHVQEAIVRHVRTTTETVSEERISQ